MVTTATGDWVQGLPRSHLEQSHLTIIKFYTPLNTGMCNSGRERWEGDKEETNKTTCRHKIVEMLLSSRRIQGQTADYNGCVEG